VLALLLERPGELITREEIERRLWPDRNVDFHHGLDVVVNRLRTVLGDNGEPSLY
jgi:DNA-binding winged helix-turn-helix (wHTH) protein